MRDHEGTKPEETELHPLEEPQLNYWQRILSFSRNAKLFLLGHALSQITLGVFSTIMNVYLLKIGFSKSFIGNYMAIGTLAAAISAIPIGVMSDRFGRRRSVLWAILLSTLSACGEVAFITPQLLMLFSFTKGIGSTFKAVVQNPFLMENSTPRERIHLFSVNQALQTAATMLGSLFAGVFPMALAFLAQHMGLLEYVETEQLRYALGCSIVFMAASAIPMWLIKEQQVQGRAAQHSVQSDLIAIFRDFNIRNLTIYRFLIGMGAGMTLPFFNVYLADALGASSEQISMVTMGSRVVLTIGTLCSPILVRYWGRIRSIIYTQLLSIPALLAIAWSPNIGVVTIIYWFRTALMNMSSPISTTLGMEIVPADKRATSSSAMNMADSLARSAAQMIGGWMMDAWGNNVPYFFTCGIYLVATLFYWRSFQQFDDPESTASLHA